MQLDLLNLQLSAGLRGDFAEGWRLALELEKQRPDDHAAAFNRGWYVMYHGDLLKGFELVDRGRIIEVFGSKPLPPEYPQWDGVADLSGKTVLLRSEGGYGDEIANARFATGLAERGANVILACHPQLLSLFERIPGVAMAVPHALELQYSFDYWVPAMSAARWLGYTYETLPGEAFLTADPALVEKWGARIKRDAGNAFKIAMRWSGNPKFEHEQHRRFDPEPLFKIADMRGVKAFSIQRDNDLRDLPDSMTDLRDDITTFEETAAAMMHMDLVITSCTVTAHLAAALGRETWVIVPILPYYLWAKPGETSPWYKTVRLFRQGKFGDWSDTLQSVNDAVQRKVGAGKVAVPPPVHAPKSAPQTQLVVPGMYFAPKPETRPLPRGHKKDRTIHFVSGFPRSGATVLMSLMAQNPRIYSAPLSGLCGMFSGVYANWDKNERHHEMPNEEAKRRVLLSLLENYHDTDRPVILDKERMWVLHLARLEELFQRPVKVIVQVRPLPEILASFEMLRRKNTMQLTAVDEALGGSSTLFTRSAYYAGDGGVLGLSYNALRDAVTSGYLDRMIFVDYNKLIGAPKMQLKRIYEFLEEPYFEHDLKNIKQIAHGKLEGFPGLHDIRPELKRTSASARDVLGPDVYSMYDKPEPWSQWT